MSKNIDKLIAAQQHANSIRPKVGGFPVLAEVLRQAGITRNRWLLPACQAIYFTEAGAIVQQGTPMMEGTYEVPKFDQEALVQAIRSDQAGTISFPEFLRFAWEAGVIAFQVDFIAREVTYYGQNEESYVEAYPAVQLATDPQ